MFKLGISSHELEGEDKEKLKSFGLNYEIVENPRERIVQLARTLIGKPYKRGSSVSKDAPNEFDCSSFTAYLYAQAGIAIPRISVDQYAFSEKVLPEEAKPGDLVFINTNRGVIYYETIEFKKGVPVPEGIDHVGVYLGNDEIIHTSSRTGKVGIEKMSEIKSTGETVLGIHRVQEADGERVAIEIPEERKDLRSRDSFLNFLKENHLITAS